MFCPDEQRCGVSAGLGPQANKVKTLDGDGVPSCYDQVTGYETVFIALSSLERDVVVIGFNNLDELNRPIYPAKLHKHIGRGGGFELLNESLNAGAISIVVRLKPSSKSLPCRCGWDGSLG